MTMDINRALRVAVNTGKVSFGTGWIKRNALKGGAKLIIVASNCPDDRFKGKEYSNVPVYQFQGTNVELGTACGKPFPISVLAIIEPGSSEILVLKESI